MLFQGAGANLVQDRGASRIRITQVTEDFFAIFGRSPVAGSVAAFGVTGEPMVVLSAGLWERAFGRDPEVVGRTLDLSGRSVRVVAVMPSDFSYPRDTEAWLSTPVVSELYGGASGPDVIAKVVSGTPIPAAEQSLQREVAERRGLALDGDRSQVPALRSVHDELTTSVRTPLIVLVGASGFVLLLALANVTAVVIAGLGERIGELSVRRALGASTIAIARGLGTEMIVLCALGGVASLLVAVWSLDGLVWLLPPDVPRLQEIELSRTALAFGLGVTAVTAAWLALAPALLTAGRVGDLPQVGGNATASRQHARWRGVLAGAQVALALVLLIGAGLLTRSLAALRGADLGFEPTHTLTLRVRLPEARYATADSWREYGEGLTAQLEELPVVRRAALVNNLPLGRQLGAAFRAHLDGENPDDQPSSSYRIVSPGYFDTMRIPVRSGRDFTPTDTPNTEPVFVVNEAFARDRGGAAVVGRSVNVRFGRSTVIRGRIVGVVGNVRHWGPESDVRPEIYRPFASAPMPYLNVVMWLNGDAHDAVPPVTATALRLDPTVPPYAVASAAQLAAETFATRQAITIVTDLFGLAAALVAGLGVYGIAANAAARRRRELGIRVALGARARNVVALVMRSGLRFAAFGIGVGLVLALGTSRILESVLFEVPPLDLMTFAGAAVALMLSSIAATYLPARRATRIEPIEALRVE